MPYQVERLERQAKHPQVGCQWYRIRDCEDQTWLEVF